MERLGTGAGVAPSPRAIGSGILCLCGLCCCVMAYCKANCYIEGKLSDGSYVKGYESVRDNVVQAVCVCLLCKS
uniref:Uncharacterized protein n=1 Tax=Setaria viridis TaxID=4556 RepID=A0A4U6TEV0_SETVI|nr:hypothetical protein SEVIR_8G016276v2 [Setaria viridis]